jgi:hypothetical protein
MPTVDLNTASNVSNTLLEPRSVAGVDPEDPYAGRPFSDPVSIFDGELRFTNSTESDERSPRPWLSEFLIDVGENGPLIDSCLSIDKVCVATERDDDRWARRCFDALYVVASRLAKCHIRPMPTALPRGAWWWISGLKSP